MKTPTELVQLVNDAKINESLPVQFEFDDKEFIVDVMEFLDLDDPSNLDSENGRIRFARNGEGFFLLVDLSDEKLEVMQEEFGDIDFIGVTLSDLLSAKCKPA